MINSKRTNLETLQLNFDEISICDDHIKSNAIII
jgi:hypothetical protein